MRAQSSYNMADFGMDTRSLAGSLAQKLDAMRKAGFSQVMLSSRDLVDHPEGLDAAVRLVKASGLRVTGLQLLRDFEGLAGRLHDYKVEVAKSLLEMAAAVGAGLLLVASSTSPHADGDPEGLARDLRKLAMLAVPVGIKVGYKASSSGRHVKDYNAAWDVLCLADAPNLGLVLDAAHVLASKTPLEDIEWLDPSRLFLVQLADVMGLGVDTDKQAVETERGCCVFPGEGPHGDQLAELVLRTSQLGYRGDYSLAVLNDDGLEMPLPTVADRARRSALWLAEDVLRLSTPLPGRMRLRSV